MDHVRWLRRLLRLLPGDSRADYARDMERTFTAQHREAARERGGLLRLWFETVRDLLRTAPREHAAQIAQDAAYAVRILRAAPAFTAAAVATLAVGIGANVAVFSIVNAVLLRPLPYPAPDGLVRIFETRARSGLFHNSASGPNVLDWQQQSTSFSGIAPYRQRSLNVSGRGEPRYVDGARAAANFFTVLGVTPARGRTFTVDEDRQDARVTVITDAFWRTQFGGDPAAVGASIDLDGEPYTVVGVLAPDFVFHMPADVWIPLGLYRGTTAGRGSHNLQVIARLREGRTVETAQPELAAIAARLEQQYPETNLGWGARVLPLHESTVEGIRPLTLIVFGAVAFVLLVACANIGSLLIARAAGRQREFAVRLALGANRTRLVRQLLTESAVLAAIGGSLGVALAIVLVEGARRFAPVRVPRLADATVDAAFGRTFFPLGDAVGQEIVVSWREQVPRRIVGVVGNLRQTALEQDAAPQMYVPYFQSPIGYGTLLARGDGDEATLAATVREAIRSVDTEQPVFNGRPLATDVNAYLAPRRVAMQALAVFATVALALALVGIYAVLSHQVRERTRELGVRMALGARAGTILRMVIRDGMVPTFAGVLAGLGGATLLIGLLASLLFETEPIDPLTFAGTAGLLLLAALAACYVPALRATRVDPSTALRAE